MSNPSLKNYIEVYEIVEKRDKNRYRDVTKNFDLHAQYEDLQDCIWICVQMLKQDAEWHNKTLYAEQCIIRPTESGYIVEAEGVGKLTIVKQLVRRRGTYEDEQQDPIRHAWQTE